MNEPTQPGFLTVHADGVTLRLKVQPRASQNQIGPVAGDRLRVRVTAPPVDSAANEAVLAALAEWLDRRRGDFQLLQGQASRQKTVKIRHATAEEILRRLAP